MSQTNKNKFSDKELAYLRAIPLLTMLDLLGWYVKEDRDYHPVNSNSKRFNISPDGNKVYELIITDNKWLDTRAQVGAGGAIDLVMHLYKEPFKSAVTRIQNALNNVPTEEENHTDDFIEVFSSIQKKEKSKAIKIRKHNKKDYYLADALNFANFKSKNDIPSMEYPIFSLATKNDKEAMVFKREGVSITITPSKLGYATVFDKDVWIYLTSLIMAVIKYGEEAPRTIYFKLYDLLKATNRSSSGEGYKLIKDSLTRLTGTIIKFDIDTKDLKMAGEFGLIDHWEIIERSINNLRMEAISVTICDLLYQSIVNTKLLTLHPDYFKLRQPLKRRLYELARKHCGDQQTWKISLENMHEKSGSFSSFKLFKQQLKKIFNHQTKNPIPEYSFILGDDMVHFFNNKNKK